MYLPNATLKQVQGDVKDAYLPYAIFFIYCSHHAILVMLNLFQHRIRKSFILILKEQHMYPPNATLKQVQGDVKDIHCSRHAELVSASH